MAYVITVANCGVKEVDAIEYTIDSARRHKRDLKAMDCGYIEIIETVDGKQADEIEDYIRERGTFGRKALKLFEGAKIL